VGDNGPPFVRGGPLDRSTAGNCAAATYRSSSALIWSS